MTPELAANKRLMGRSSRWRSVKRQRGLLQIKNKIFIFHIPGKKIKFQVAKVSIIE